MIKRKKNNKIKKNHLHKENISLKNSDVNNNDDDLNKTRIKSYIKKDKKSMHLNISARYNDKRMDLAFMLMVNTINRYRNIFAIATFQVHSNVLFQCFVYLC